MWLLTIGLEQKYSCKWTIGIEAIQLVLSFFWFLILVVLVVLVVVLIFSIQGNPRHMGYYL